MTMPASMMDILPSLKEPGKRLVDAGELYSAFMALFGSQFGIAGGAAAPGPTLSTYMNEVTSGAFVSLPPALPGKQVLLLTTSALTVGTVMSNPANGGVADTVDGGATVAQAADTTALYICYAPGKWSQAALPAPV